MNRIKQFFFLLLFSLLPFFALAHEGHAEQTEAVATSFSLSFPLYRLIVPLGVATYLLIILTALSGIFRRKLKRRFMPLHKTLVILTICVATTHALIAWLGY